MPFSPRTHSSQTHSIYQFAGTITTRSSTIYKRPVKPRVFIYNNTGETLLYVYDAFNPNGQTDEMEPSNGNPPHVMSSLNVTIGKNQNNFDFAILDERNTWQRRKISEGNVVRIYAGKTTGTLQFLTKGYIKKMRPKQIGNGIRQLTFVGIGEKSETNNIKITFQRQATSITFDTDFNIPTRPDSQMAVHVLVKEVLESLNVQVVAPNETIKDHLHLDTSGISPLVDIRILSVSFIDVELATVLDFFAQITGAIWDIRDGKFIFEYPKQKHSGIALKANTNDKAFDLADSVGYFVGNDGWEYDESIDKGDGFMTHTTVKTIIATKSVANVSESGGNAFNVATLYKTHLAVQFSALDSRFITIKFVLSKIGDPTGGVNDPENPVILYGDIITDNNNTPTGSVVTTFQVEYQGLTSSPTDVFINDIKVDAAVSSPNTFYWLRLKAIGLSRGDSVRWHHDNNVSIEGRRSAYALGDTEETNLSWKVSNRGPMYNFTVFSKIQRIQHFGDQDAADRYNRTDSSLDVTYLEDVESVSKVAQMELSMRSNPVRIYDAKQVMIPNNKLYYPGEMVTIIDPILGLDENENVEAEIQEVEYPFDGNDLGLRYVTLKPMGEYLYKKEDLSDTT